MTDLPHAPADHPPIALGQVGVLFVNLGSPDDATPAAVKRYLKQFLSDRRVIELNPLIWQPILRGIVLNVRPKKTAAAYREIWMEGEEGSPLRHYTRMQAEAVQTRHNNLIVDWAMRYGSPSISDRLHKLKDDGCDRILIVPMYPQYSATTTASVSDEVFRVLGDMRWQPTIRVAPPFHDHSAYIVALAGSIQNHLAGMNTPPDAIIASYHGIPKPYFEAGDPYHCHCAKTTRLLRETLAMDDQALRLTFQSRFGFQEWLQPYTDKTLEALPGEGIKRVAVLAPSFVADCLETLEEMAIQGKETFLEAGGEDFSYIPCLNDSTAAVDLFSKIVETETAGWI